jgi:uncharacterized membrane protein YdjX (TVP38/TMEM64 family)
MWPRVLLVVVLLAGLIAGTALSWQEGLSLQAVAEGGEDAKRLVEANPVVAPFVFIALAAFAIALSFPAVAILKIICGFLFGWLSGTFYIVVAAAIGGVMLFVTTRSAFGGFLRGRAAATDRLAEEFERGAFTYILAMRLAPFVPFAVVSIAPALFEVRLRTFVAATIVGVMPGALCYAWLGQGLEEALETAKAADRRVQLSDLVTTEITLALTALTLVAVLAAIVRKVRGPRAS